VKIRIKEKFKFMILKYLYERYGIEESDFMSAELTMVSAILQDIVDLIKD
jgi:aspartyl aminopeptidase